MFKQKKNANMCVYKVWSYILWIPPQHWNYKSLSLEYFNRKKWKIGLKLKFHYFFFCLKYPSHIHSYNKS